MFASLGQVNAGHSISKKIKKVNAIQSPLYRNYRERERDHHHHHHQFLSVLLTVLPFCKDTLFDLHYKVLQLYNTWIQSKKLGGLYIINGMEHYAKFILDKLQKLHNLIQIWANFTLSQKKEKKGN